MNRDFGHHFRVMFPVFVYCAHKVIMKSRLFAHLEVDVSRWHLFNQICLQKANPYICCWVHVVDHHRLAFR